MASDQQLSISGSVIQRSLIPGDLGMVLNIATVPLAELQVDKEASKQELLRGLIAEILGIPNQSVMDEKQYQNLRRQLADFRFWEEWFNKRYAPPYYYDFYYQTARILAGKMQAKESGNISLATDSLCLMASPISQIPPLIDFLLPFGSVLGKEDDSPAGQLGISSESFQLGMASILAGLSPEYRVAKFTDDAKSYEIPSGQSPQIKSESLLKLIETSKSFCIAPLGAGATIGITQLGQGAFINALLYTGTGAIMTLALIGTVSVADLLIRYLMQKRPKYLQDSNPDQKQTKRASAKQRARRAS